MADQQTNETRNGEAPELVALQRTIGEGFGRVERHLDRIEEALHDNHQGVHGLLSKLLRGEDALGVGR